MWASYRGQTLARTVRGIMYYHRALLLQALLESSSGSALSESDLSRSCAELSARAPPAARAAAEAAAAERFTYVVSAQIYGKQRARSDQKAADIQYLLRLFPNLRVAYVDEAEDTPSTPEGAGPAPPAPATPAKAARRPAVTHYSVLIKASARTGLEEEVYRVRLPGPAKVGEGKPENQNHAVIFTRGEALQAIDMNQSLAFEDALKARNLVRRFEPGPGGAQPPAIVGVRENVFTAAVSSLASFMSLQETAFVTIGQRVLASPLRVRFHYGHPDFFDRLRAVTTGGVSKASPVINLSEDIFSGYNQTLRGGHVVHDEFIQAGKGRDVGLVQISLFESKVASGNGEQLLSRDVYRLGQALDLARTQSFFWTTLGLYVSNFFIMMALFAFAYGRCYAALAGVEPQLEQEESLALAPLTSFNVVILVFANVASTLPWLLETVLEAGLLGATRDLVAMLATLGPLFFMFETATKAHWFQATVTHGGAKYRKTGRGFVVRRAGFAELYRHYGRSHFAPALELVYLLLVYAAYGTFSGASYGRVTFAAWVMASAMLATPFVFNPSGFEWHKTVEDYEAWWAWLVRRGGPGTSAEDSWQTWWDDDNASLANTGWLGRLARALISVRFFFFQWGIVYNLGSISDGARSSLMAYGVSWAVLGALLCFSRLTTWAHLRFGDSHGLFVRMGTIVGILALVIVAALLVEGGILGESCCISFGDVVALATSMCTSLYGLLQLAIAFEPFTRWAGLLPAARAVARGFDACIGGAILLPLAILSFLPFVSELQGRLLFNQAFSRGLGVAVLLQGAAGLTPASAKKAA